MGDYYFIPDRPLWTKVGGREYLTREVHEKYGAPRRKRSEGSAYADTLIYFHTEPTVNINTALTCDLFVMRKPSRTFVFASFSRLKQVFKKYILSLLLQVIKRIPLLV